MIAAIILLTVVALEALYILFLKSRIGDRESEIEGKNEHIAEQDRKLQMLVDLKVPEDLKASEVWRVIKHDGTYWVEVYKDGVPWENYAESNSKETLQIIKNLLGE
jgi:hypothetical protein